MNSLTLPRWFGRKKRKEKEEEKAKRKSVNLSENPYENLQFLQPPPMSSLMSNGVNADLDVNEAIRGCSAASEAVVQYRFHSTPLGDRSSSRVDDYFDDDLYEDQHLSNSREGQNQPQPRRSRPFSFDELSSQGQIWSYFQQHQGIIKYFSSN